MEGELLREVEGDEGHVEGEAGILQGLVGCGPDREDVVCADEGGEAVVGGGRVGEGEGCAVEDVRELLGGAAGLGGEVGEGRGMVSGRGLGEGVIEGDRAVAEGGGEGEGLEELVPGGGGGPLDVEIVEHGGLDGSRRRQRDEKSSMERAS